MPNSVNAQFLVDRLMVGGLSRAQASALVGNFQQESSLNPNAYNPAEGAFGLMQWRGDRLAGLQQYANQQGKNPADPQVQADYALHEMHTTEAGTAKNFLNATTVNEANKALYPVIRYGNPAEAGLRASYGQQINDDPNADRGGPQAAAVTQAPDVSRETANQPTASRAQYADPFDTYEQFKLDRQMQQPKGIRGGLTALGYGLTEGAKPVIQKAGGLGSIFGMGAGQQPGSVQPGTPAGLTGFMGLFGKPQSGSVALGMQPGTQPQAPLGQAPVQPVEQAPLGPPPAQPPAQSLSQEGQPLDPYALQNGDFGALV